MEQPVRYVTVDGCNLDSAGWAGRFSSASSLHQTVNINIRHVALERLFRLTCFREQSDLCVSPASVNTISPPLL